MSLRKHLACGAIGVAQEDCATFEEDLIGLNRTEIGLIIGFDSLLLLSAKLFKRHMKN